MTPPLRRIVARFAGPCAFCPHEIRVGDPILFGRGRRVRHVECADPRGERRPPRPAPVAELPPIGCGCIAR